MDVNDEYVSIQTQTMYNYGEIAQWILIGKWVIRKLEYLYH